MKLLKKRRRCFRRLMTSKMMIMRGGMKRRLGWVQKENSGKERIKGQEVLSCFLRWKERADQVLQDDDVLLELKRLFDHEDDHLVCASVCSFFFPNSRVNTVHEYWENFSYSKTLDSASGIDWPEFSLLPTRLHSGIRESELHERRRQYPLTPSVRLQCFPLGFQLRISLLSILFPRFVREGNF